MLYYIIVFILFLPVLILFPTRVIGRKNILKKGKMIFVCNHQSNMDAIIIALRIKRRFKFMAKAELFKNWFSNKFVRAIGGYPVNRKQNDIESVKQTLRYLKDDKAVCIFPEGTRVKANESVEAKNGTALFALKSHSPIVPAYIIKKPSIFRPNKFVIGEAFNLSEMEQFKDKPIDKELLTEATKIITTKMHELKDKYTKKRSK